MTARFLPVLLGALAGCATPPPPPPPEPPAPRKITDEQLYAPVMWRTGRSAVDQERPPPPRRRREYILDERTYRRVAQLHPLGIPPAACAKLCRQEEAATPSDDHRWTWLLRCALDRSVRDEPVVQCREDALEPEKAEKLLTAQ